MKKAIYLLLIFLLASCGSDTTSRLSTDGSPEIGPSSSKITIESVLSDMDRGMYREGELLVKFRTGTRSASSSRAHQTIGATSLRTFSIVPNLEHVRLPEGLSVKDAIRRYMSDPAVEYASPNYLKHATVTPVTPNDQFFSLQWGMPKINAPGAWDLTKGSKSIIVGVLDTGVDPTHPDLAANVVQGVNCVVNPSTPTPDATDDNGHGTHVSGIIGAIGNNGIGVAGLMWNVQIMPLKILDANGSGTTANEICGIDFAVAHGVKVMNASFAGGGFDQAEYDALSRANSSKLLLVTAAGNGGGALCDSDTGVDIDSSPCYPASFSNPNDPELVKRGLPALTNVIGVAATDQSDNMASFSNFGHNSVQVAAPGVSILSTIPLNLPPCTSHPFDPNYDNCTGTSQAAPHVTGLAGLIYSQNPGLSHYQVRSIILNSVDVLPSLNKIQTSGRINALSALTAQIAPKISVSPASADFGTVTIGGTSSTQTFTVTNGGTANLVIGQISVTGANASEFSVSSDGCSGRTVEPLFNCAIQAKFSPTSSGARSAAMAIPSNAAASPVVNVALSGTGAEPPPSGSGGGCSIGGGQDTPSAIADSAFILLPMIVLAALRGRRKFGRKC